MGKGKNGKTKNNFRFKIHTSKGLVKKIEDIEDEMIDIYKVEVIDFKTGKKIGSFKFEEFKLKFG